MGYNSIILSGVPASGKSTLAERLSEFFEWPIYSIGQSWRDKWRELYPSGGIPFEEYWRNTTREENLEVNQMARQVFERGCVTGDTRYSLYCKDLPALLVLVTASLDIRARRSLNTDRYRGKSLEEVRQTLIERERDELRVGQDLYGTDYDYKDPIHYHLALNSGLLTVDEEIAIVTSFVKP